MPFAPTPEKVARRSSRAAASFFPDVPQELVGAALERYQRAGLWSRTTTVSKAGFDRLAYSLHDGGFIKRRATYAECATHFGRPA
jgi:NitT/TauT family transport system substrate-binding protein